MNPMLMGLGGGGQMGMGGAMPQQGPAPMGGPQDQGDAIAIPLILQALQALMAEAQGGSVGQPNPFGGYQG